MTNFKKREKGIVLFMVLGVMFIIILICIALMGFMKNQSRQVQHKIDRNKATQADQSGVVYTLEMLRTGTWTVPVSGTTIKTFCPGATGCDVNNSGLPYRVTVTIYPLDTDPPGPATAISGTAPITATVDYTYTP